MFISPLLSRAKGSTQCLAGPFAWAIQPNANIGVDNVNKQMFSVNVLNVNPPLGVLNLCDSLTVSQHMSMTSTVSSTTRYALLSQSPQR